MRNYTNWGRAGLAVLLAGLLASSVLTAEEAAPPTAPPPQTQSDPPVLTQAAQEVLPTVTPGAVRTSDRDAICGSGTAELRGAVRSRAMRARITAAYGSPARGTYVFDHLIPLGVGGADKEENLWPEPRSVSYAKDACERRARSMICSRGTLTPAEAQRGFARDWKIFCTSIGARGPFR